ncbi:MAG: ABC transporter permease subunit [Elusimicrobiales bacterium]|nr:ABC transporter permease subunit [Elusimicrobiales bacterium]
MEKIDFKNVVHIIKKEIKHYLDSPHSYVLITVFLIITGYFFAQPLFLINQANLNSLVDVVPLILTFFIPAITMKLIAEEKKTQTIEIILTLPLTEEEIIIGKYLSAVTIMIISILLMLIYALTLIFLSKPDYGHIVGTYLSIFFTSLTFTAAGLFASTLSSSQITAFIGGFAVCFILYLSGKITFFLPLSIQNAVSYIGIDYHISNMSRGVLDLKDIVYFVSISIFFIYLSIYNIKQVRK